MIIMESMNRLLLEMYCKFVYFCSKLLCVLVGARARARNHTSEHARTRVGDFC